MITIIEEEVTNMDIFKFMAKRNSLEILTACKFNVGFTKILDYMANVHEVKINHTQLSERLKHLVDYKMIIKDNHKYFITSFGRSILSRVERFTTQG